MSLLRNTCLIAALSALLCACSPGSIQLAGMPDGGSVAFVQNQDGSFGMVLGGTSRAAFTQPTPVTLSFSGVDSLPYSVSTGYGSVRKTSRKSVRATASIETASGTGLAVTDDWTVSDGRLVLDRTVDVSGSEDGLGFASSFYIDLPSGTSWDGVDFFAPGLLYGDPTYDGPSSPGGTRFDEDRLFTFREDFLPSPMYGALMEDGRSITILDLEPDAATTLEETRRGMSGDIMIGDDLRVGSFSSFVDGGSVRMGFTMPSSTGVYPRRRLVWSSNGQVAASPETQTPQMQWSRRFNPVSEGNSQHYRLAVRIADDGTFPQFIRESYRWAWTELRPQLEWHDIELVRRSLSDQLSSLVTTFGDRTGLPYQVKTKSGQVWEREGDPAFYWRAPLGFVGKHVESAVQLLNEGYRDDTERGQKMRQQGLAMIETAIKYIPTDRAVCGGVNLMDGSYSATNPPIWYLRELTDDMVRLVEAYVKEESLGISHPDWLKWCRDAADWALALQREDGSLPRSFRIGSDDVVEASGTTSYNIVPLFVLLTKVTGDRKYQDAGLKAAEYVWESYGKRGVFIGGAIDNPNITDKEAGLLSLEAFMSLYEATGDEKWLERSKTAADFAETWTWNWNVPMPEDAPEEELNWKHGVPTVGVQGITAQVAGHVDQFLDMSIPAYMKLYKYTGDRHYFDFAKILMHNCKIMIALPDRMYGMYAPGFQTENFRMGADPQGRGYGTPEKWMPWVTTNHLFGINAAEDYDKELFDELCRRD